MSGIELNREALAKLRGAVRTQRGRLATVGDGFPPKDAPSASLFGTLAGAEALAAAIGRVDGHADGEFGTVSSRLDGVERALDLIEENVRTAHRTTETGLPAI
ncbi:hypothetical protein Skr01_04630 [Sphaerisporangium krabiense]|uniref:Uncharacterized protein n=1 Tax=Sphaerisporangium krabiense TaxID=763782 RepID=A0A7W9DSV7_9ACTN|nr:hypothetical protein [Sphaerisporangium krabiense]MBB5628780.1 hypothetical protein [Sphaerisporangium krabiense]GII60378.1 hypothetical protein Skr01_04630 [Sphaerisporangium krabiense]